MVDRTTGYVQALSPLNPLGFQVTAYRRDAEAPVAQEPSLVSSAASDAESLRAVKFNYSKSGTKSAIGLGTGKPKYVAFPPRSQVKNPSLYSSQKYRADPTEFIAYNTA